MTHISVGTNTNIGSDNGLSPSRRQAIIWTNAGILLIGPLATNFSEILIEIINSYFKKMRLKVSSAKWRPSCLGLNVLTGVFTMQCSVIIASYLAQRFFSGVVCIVCLILSIGCVMRVQFGKGATTPGQIRIICVAIGTAQDMLRLLFS